MRGPGQEGREVNSEEEAVALNRAKEHSDLYAVLAPFGYLSIYG